MTRTRDRSAAAIKFGHDLDDQARRILGEIACDDIAKIATTRPHGWRRALNEILRMVTSGTVKVLLDSPPTKRPRKNPAGRRVESTRQQQRALWPLRIDESQK